MADNEQTSETTETAPTEAEMHECMIRYGFGGDEKLYDEFVRILRETLPVGTRVVMRGSCITGKRWRDGAPFDADGPGTSDLDLTLVGDDVLSYYILDGFYVPGVHSKPLSDKDPDIAPDLVPLRERLVSMVKRPVNIQGTRDLVMYLRGDLLGQPYATLIESVERP